MKSQDFRTACRPSVTQESILRGQLTNAESEIERLNKRLARLYEDKRTLERELMRLQRAANERSE